MKSKLAFATVLLGSATLVACQILLGIDDTTVTAEASSSGATSSSSSSSSSGEAERCPDDPRATAHPGPRPDAGPEGDGGEVPLVFAIRTISLTGEEGTFGYDLDGYYTSDAAPPRCRTPSGTAAVDDEGGRDNASVKVLVRRTGNFGIEPSSLSEQIQADIDDGKGTTLFRIEGYNGQANDDAVAIRVASSLGLHRADPDAGAPVPAWDGTDVWTLQVNQGPNPSGDLWYAQSRIEGYVRDHQLIVQQARELGDGFRFPLFGRSIEFNRGVLSARLTDDDDDGGSIFRFEDGMMAGTAAPVDVYMLLRDIPLLKVTRICRLHETEFGSVCGNLIAGADIPAEGYCSGDVPATQPCERISLTFGFTAVQAQAVAAVPSDAGAPPLGPAACAPFDFDLECVVK